MLNSATAPVIHVLYIGTSETRLRKVLRAISLFKYYNQKTLSTRSPQHPLLSLFCSHKPPLLMQYLHKYLPLLLHRLGWVGFAVILFSVKGGWLFCHGQWWEYTVRLIYMWATGLQSSTRWDVILICSLSSKPCKNIRGHQKSQTLCMLDIDKPLSAVPTAALAPHPASMVKRYWDVESSHVTYCSGCIISKY